jgi:mRNA interferase MazF
MTLAEHREDVVFRDFEIGDVVTVRLPLHRPEGHEQEGYRPAIVVGVPELAGEPRFGVLIVAPLTSDRDQDWARGNRLLYPRITEGTANLRVSSICPLDQIRSLARRRVVRRRGRLSSEEFSPVLRGLLALFGQALSD